MPAQLPLIERAPFDSGQPPNIPTACIDELFKKQQRDKNNASFKRVDLLRAKSYVW